MQPLRFPTTNGHADIQNTTTPTENEICLCAIDDEIYTTVIMNPTANQFHTAGKKKGGEQLICELRLLENTILPYETGLTNNKAGIANAIM